MVGANKPCLRAFCLTRSFPLVDLGPVLRIALFLLALIWAALAMVTVPLKFAEQKGCCGWNSAYFREYDRIWFFIASCEFFLFCVRAAGGRPSSPFSAIRAFPTREADFT